MCEDPLKKSGVYRPFTIWAAGLMELTLLLNDQRGKGAWETEDLTALMCKREEEIGEVVDALENRDGAGKSHPLVCEENRTSKAMLHLRDELIDEAVTCCMIAARLDPEMSQLERGRLK